MTSLINSSENVTNITLDHLPGGYDSELQVEDTNWILTSAFIIFTMQTGFGMLESGCVSIKNEVNIMMKNVADVVLGGLTYWMFGYGISFGKGPLTNPFIAIGGFFIDPSVGDELMGPIFAAFLFQLSFATTATTIVSGAMAERCDFKAYCIFSLLNTAVYCIPAGWVWGEHGFLYNMGVVDIAGSGPVHLIGGSASFASAFMLGPRLGRYANGRASLPPGSPVNAVMGLFVLWWGWLAFNSGSTYGVSGSKWQYAARAAVVTMIGSFGGGVFGLLYSLIRFKGKLDLIDLINSILGSLVSVTAGCYLYHAWEALLIGVIGAAITCFTTPLVDMMGVDDPVGASSVHGFSGMWGVIAVGLFAGDPIPLDTTRGRNGLFKGGGWYLLGVQSLAAICLAAWGILSTTLLLWCISCFTKLRMNEQTELLGADITEHMIRHGTDDTMIALEVLGRYMNVEKYKKMDAIGSNSGHKAYIKQKYLLDKTTNIHVTAANDHISSERNQNTLNHRKGLPNFTFKVNPEYSEYPLSTAEDIGSRGKPLPNFYNELAISRYNRFLFDENQKTNDTESNNDIYRITRLPRASANGGHCGHGSGVIIRKHKSINGIKQKYKY